MAARLDTRTTDLVDGVVQLSYAVHDILTRAAAEHDLSVTQLRLLGILRDRTPPMTALANHLGLDRSSVTGLVDRAERRGLVERRASTQDARVIFVRVTAKGVKTGRTLAERISRDIDTLLLDLPEAGRECLVRAAEAVLRDGDGRGL